VRRLDAVEQAAVAASGNRGKIQRWSSSTRPFGMSVRSSAPVVYSRMF
jgi:hypothetical protein